MNNTTVIDSLVQKVGTRYFTIGQHADLWKGQLLGPGDTSEKIVAIKVLRGGSLDKPDFLVNLKRTLETRGAVWKTFNHENVARFHGLAYNCSVMPALVLDFFQNGNINQFMKQCSLGDANKVTLTKEIALGMQYLHRLRPPTIHGDIRGANVLINAGGHAVLADYDLASAIDTSDFTTAKIAGSCRWSAPELMDPDSDQDSAPQFTLASDVFAFAMTIIEVFTQSQPFPEKREGAIIFNIINGKRPDLPSYIQGRAAFSDLVKRCWNGSPEARPSADEIVQVLESFT